VKTLKRTYRIAPFGCPATNDLEVSDGDRQMMCYKNRAGRPLKKRRLKSQLERARDGEKASTNKCGQCNQIGHNRSNCPMGKPLAIDNTRAANPYKKRKVMNTLCN